MGFNFDFSEFLNDKSKNLEEQEILYISARDLRPISNEQNFYHADPDSITKMARSIELVGVQQPLVVKTADTEGKYDVLVGHTRRLAVLQLCEEGKRDNDLLPCIVDQSQDDTLQELILIFTNSTQRERTDAEKMREVARLRVLLNEYKEEHPDFSGNMQQIIADILGISKSKVGRLDNINNNLSDTLKEKFESGKLNISTANELARLDEAGQKAMEKKMEEQGSLSMQEAKQAYADQLMQVPESEEQEETEEILEETEDIVEEIRIHPEEIPEDTELKQEQSEKAERLLDAEIADKRRCLDKVLEDSREFLGLDTSVELVKKLANDVLGSFTGYNKEPLFGIPNMDLMDVDYNIDGSFVHLPDFVFKFYKSVVDMVLDVVESFAGAEKDNLDVNKCITGMSKYGICGSAAFCSEGHMCCASCTDGCNVRCGWLK